MLKNNCEATDILFRICIMIENETSIHPTPKNEAHMTGT